MRSRTAGKMVERKAAVEHHSVTLTVTQPLRNNLAEKLILCFDSDRDLMGGNLYMAFSLSHTRSVSISHVRRCNYNNETYLFVEAPINFDNRGQTC